MIVGVPLSVAKEESHNVGTVPKPDVRDGLSGVTLPVLVAVVEKEMSSAFVTTHADAQTTSEALNVRVTLDPSVPSAVFEKT